MEQIEEICDDLPRIPSVTERSLQRLKTAFAFGIEDARLHVQYGVFGLQVFECRGERRKASCPVLTVARAKKPRPAGNKTQQTVTVELKFMHPLRAFRWLVNERRELHFGITLHQTPQLIGGLRRWLFLLHGGLTAGDFLHRTAAFHTGGKMFQKIAVRAILAGFSVILLDQQPVFALIVAAH